MRDIVHQARRIDDSEARAGQSLLAGKVRMSADVTESQRVCRALEHAGVEQFGHLGGRHRAVGHASCGRHHFDQRFQPIQSARAVAHDAHLASAFGRFRLYGLRAVASAPSEIALASPGT